MVYLSLSLSLYCLCPCLTNLYNVYGRCLASVYSVYSRVYMTIVASRHQKSFQCLKRCAARWRYSQ